MATPSVLAFDAEGRAIDLDVWIDDLQLFLQCDRADGLSLFDLTSGASPAPAADADATLRSLWAMRDAAARLAVRRHLPTSERAHFSQYKSAQTLYNAVVARYSSPATAALSRLMLPYLFPDLATFPTVADLITHLRTSDTRFRAALPAEFCAKNPPPMYIVLYYIVTRLLDPLHVVRDHLLSVCPTTLTVDLLEKALLAAEKSIVAVGASRGDPRTPIFEGRSVRRLPLAGDVALARARGARALEGLAGAVEEAVEAAEGVGVAVGVAAGVEVSVAAVEVEAAAAVAVGAEVAEVEAVEEAVAEEVELVGVALRKRPAPVVVSASSSSSALVTSPPPHQLREWYAARQRGGGTGPCTYVLRTGDRADEQCGRAHPTQRCFGRLTNAWHHQFPKATEIPYWGELSRAGVAIFDLEFDAILAAMYAVTISDEGDCYRCFPPDPGIGTAALGTGEAVALGASEATALGASASASSGAGESALSSTAWASASLTFTLESRASRSFFRDRTTLAPLSQLVAVSLAYPSWGPVLSHFSTVLPCPAAPSGTLSGIYFPSFSTNLVSGADLQDAGVHQFTPASQRVTHSTEARIGRNMATFTRRPGSSLYTLTTESPPVTSSGQVAASGQVFAAASRSGPESAPCSCRLLSYETLLWHHRLGHPSLLRLRGMASNVLVCGLLRSLPPLPLGPGPTCVLCVEGRQRAAPHSSQFPPTEAPLQMLHMDVWGPARVRGQGHKCYFLLVVEDYSRYTTVFPLRSKSDVTEVLIDWIRAARLQLKRSFGLDFPLLRLHSDRDAVEPVEVTGHSGAAGGGEPGGAKPWGADSGGAERVGATPGGTRRAGGTTRGAEPGGAATMGAEFWGAVPGGATPGGAKPWCATPGGAEHGGATSEAAEPGGAEPAAAGPARVASGGAGPGGARTGSTGAAGPAGTTRAGGAEDVGAEATAVSPGGGPAGGAPGAVGSTTAGGAVGAVSGVAARPRPYFVPLLQQVLGPPPSLECPQPVQSQSQLPPASPLPALSPYTGPTGGLVERREPASRPASPVRAGRTSGRGSRQRPPPVPGTHRMSLRPSTAPLRVPLPSPPKSSLSPLADPESDSLRAASPTVTRLLATVVTNPSFESTAASALVAELVDFAARCRLDYAASLVAESASVCPPSVGGKCALGRDVLEDRQEEFQCLAAASPHLVSVLLTPEGDPDALDIPTPRSYAEAVEGPYSS
ncbi:unnamed protein product [Closterium sp. NIES-65]|nr:unnamed protein product [Closterium sp. NIES-65]